MKKTLIETNLLHSKRIPALDFWRGFYLLMIYINHVPNNPLPLFTLRSWGFSDSAEAFVFISGFSSMLAFGPFFNVGGLGVGLLRAAKRAWQLFCAHVLLVFALSAIIALAGEFVDSKQIMKQLNFTPFFIETDVALIKLLKLGYMPNMTDILPLYIVFVLFFPLVWVLMRLSSFLALGFSFALWLGVNIAGLSVPTYPEGAVWFFNPLAWQLLFVSGMVAYKERELLKRFVFSKPVFWAAIGIVAASALAIAPWTNIHALSPFKIIPPELLPADNKMNLSWSRVVHLFALAIIGVNILSYRELFWKNTFVRAVSLCGKHSLAIFCAGTGLSLFMHVLLLMGGLGAFQSSLLVLGGVVLLVFVAWVLESSSLLLKTTAGNAKASANKEPSVAACTATH